MSIDDILTEILEFIIDTNEEKHIFLLNKFSPISFIARVILEFKLIICSNMKNEELIHIVTIINLNINCDGDSNVIYVKFDNKYFIAKYSKNPNTKELAINSIPFVDDVPKISKKCLSFSILESIKTILSSIL